MSCVGEAQAARGANTFISNVSKEGTLIILESGPSTRMAGMAAMNLQPNGQYQNPTPRVTIDKGLHPVLYTTNTKMRLRQTITTTQFYPW